MRQSFYTWLMAQRNPASQTTLAILAELIFADCMFPKHTDNFETISQYLENEADFVFNLSEFDKIWEDYLAH